MSESVELAVTYLTVTGETSSLGKAVKKEIATSQAYADAHPLKLSVDTSKIGKVKVDVSADTSTFDRQIAAATSKRSSVSVSVATELETTAARTQMAAFRRSLESQGAVSIPVHLDMAGAVASASSSSAISEAIQVSPDMSAFMDQVESQLASIDVSGLADRIREQMGPVFADIGGPVDVDVAAASAQLDNLTRDRRIHIGLDVDWVPLLGAVAALIALRRMIEINLSIPLDDILAVDTTLARLTVAREAQVNVEVDQSTAATAETRLAEIARNRRVELNVDSAALAGLTALGSHAVTLDVAINQDSLTTVNAALAHIARDRTVTFHADVDAASARVADALLDHLARRRSATFSAALDASAAARMEILMRLLSRDRSVNFDTSGITGVGTKAEAATRSLTAMSAVKMTGLIAGIGTITPLLLGVGGAAAGAMGALGIGFAGLGPAALAAAGTVAVAMNGIKDTFSALKSAEDSASSDSESRASAVAAAQKQIKSALKEVASANQDLEDSNQDLEDSQRDLNLAYKDAADNLEDLKMAADDAALSEKEAAQALKDANDDLADAKTPKEREKALLRIERAQLNLAKAQEANRDAQDANREAEAKGIEGSDAVTSARDKVTSATEKVAAAEERLREANASVAEAQQAAIDAANKGSSAQQKAAKALAELSPSAREWVLAVKDLKPAWDEVEDATQDAFFANAATGIRDLATAALPTLKTGLVDVAGSMNGLISQFAAFWSAPQNLAGVQSILAGTANFIDGLGPGLQQATQGFLSMGQAFEPVANKIGAQLGGMLGQIGQAFTAAFESGALTQLLSTFGDIIAGLGAGLNPLIAGLIQMGNIVGPTLGPLFTALGQAVQTMAPALGQLGATFATTLTAIMPELANFISQLATGLAPVLPVIGDLLQSVLGFLTPMIGPLSQIAQVVGQALSQAITALTPAIGPLSTAIVSLVTAIAPIIPVVAEVVAGLIQALAPALTTIFDALSPVIKQIADAMMPVFKQLQPILADVATKIGTALVNALTQIAPYIPQIAQAFGDLVLAIAPMIPQLVEIALSLLPPFLDIVIAIIPIVTKFIDVLTWLVNNVISPLLIPAVKNMSEVIGGAMETIAGAINTARDKIGTALDKIGGFFGGIADTAKQRWDEVVKIIASRVKTIGELLVKAGSSDIPYPGKDGVKSAGESLVAWAQAQGAATGGFATGSGIAKVQHGGRKVYGPGTGTSDSVLAMLGGKPIALSNGEFISTEQAYENGAPLLWALNSGWVPSPEFLSAMVGGIPGFATGGVPGKKFAESMDPASYLMGGFSRQSIDCSGMVSAVVNDALGLNPFDSRMYTGNEGQWLKNKGAKSGMGGAGDISIGWYDQGGGANGHTAMTLGDGTNVESRGTDGVVVGANARGASDKMFDQVMHLPAALLQGGDGGGKGTGGGTGGGAPSLGGGTGGSGGGAAGSGGSGGSSSGGSSSRPSGTAVPVWVDNAVTIANLGTATTTSTGTGTGTGATPTATTPTTTTTAPTTTGSGPTTTGTTSSTGYTGDHPLKGMALTGDLFNGEKPWYMGDTVESSVNNLQSRAQTLAQSGVSQVQTFFQENWKEMLSTGAGVLGMGAMGGGTVMNVTNNGMSPEGAAAAVERVVRRTNLATMRSGGMGR